LIERDIWNIVATNRNPMDIFAIAAIENTIYGIPLATPVS